MSFTSRRVAGSVFASLLGLAFGARAQCPAPLPTALLERFIPADCEACWSTGSAPTGKPFVLDWIVPSARGDDAPLSAAALAEASTRAARLPRDRSAQVLHALPANGAPRVSVEDGPAWNGYIGLQLRVRRQGAPLPAGAVGYLALVENVVAGDEGSPIERRLVRALAGPLALDGERESTEHLLALRLPSGMKMERLGAVGWVESPSGKLVALAQASPLGCTEAK